jgi:hypothetical protein
LVICATGSYLGSTNAATSTNKIVIFDELTFERTDIAALPSALGAWNMRKLKNGALLFYGEGTSQAYIVDPSSLTSAPVVTSVTLPAVAYELPHVTKTGRVIIPQGVTGGGTTNTANYFVSDDNGLTWTTKTFPVAVTQAKLFNIERLNRIVAVINISNNASGTANAALTSDDDGETWTRQTTPALLPYGLCAYNQALGVGINVFGWNSKVINLTSDGVTWKTFNYPITSNGYYGMSFEIPNGLLFTSNYNSGSGGVIGTLRPNFHEGVGGWDGTIV